MDKKHSVKMLELHSDEVSQLSQILSQKKAQKILEVLAKEPLSESQIAEKLGFALSTVHHNVQKLVQVGMVKSTKFEYSKKGREIQHYELTHNPIIIQTKPSFSMSFLQQLIPGVLIFLSGFFLYQFYVPEVEVEPQIMRMSDEVIATSTTQLDFFFFFALVSLAIICMSFAITYLLSMRKKV
ncbi:MAG: ArsR/SmtB family transcription factor [Candidatus Woesearchaeota archaeon]